jgi:hypothetical protein
MLQPDALAELENRVKGMDALPRSLDLLRLAIEATAAGLSIQVKMQMDGSYLRVEHDGSCWNVRVEDNDYHYFYMHHADTWDSHEQSTSELAWDIVGLPRLFRRAIALAAAKAQGEIAKKNG